MSPLSQQVRVARRFRRSVRLETDLSDPAALEGFKCPASSEAVLTAMATHVSGTGQGAFTWTGPYGAGKSSLAAALGQALEGPAAGELAYAAFGTEVANTLHAALPPGPRGWRVLAVTGRRAVPSVVIGEALLRARLVRQAPAGGWTDEAVLDRLDRISKRTPSDRGGLLVLIDEMGKFLEAAAHDGTDIYILQELAELASRSAGRLLVVGILHQSFDEYALRLSRETRDEWAKIQGRFADLTVSASPDEMLAIIARAIEQDQVPDRHHVLCTAIAALIDRPDIARSLASAWPLHPVVACLLGPISRRRFGQNQRSVFGFLNSAEPLGFQDFLATAGEDDLYTPNMLWDYLRFNLEQSILASPDGHRWALAVDAVARWESAGLSDLHLDVLKTVALVDLFRERSALVASSGLLSAVSGDIAADVLRDLEDASLVIHRRFNDSYGVFAGSDFDIEQAVEDAYGLAGTLDYERLTELAGFQPIIAKRHYHETGALRWFGTAIVTPGGLTDAVRRHAPTDGSAGAFLLVLPMEGDAPDQVERYITQALDGENSYEPAIGLPQRPAWGVASLARDLLALEYVRDHTPALQGDRVARIEVAGRIAALREQIGRELHRALDNAVWRTSTRDLAVLRPAQLNALASDLADQRFAAAPRVHNELLNRAKPSSNAVAAQNALLRQMALGEGEPRLGIEGFPAEGGLFVSLIMAARLYRFGPEGWRFRPPDEDDDPCRLRAIWVKAEQVLTQHASGTVPVAEIWAEWRKPPFGVKDGLMPVLTAAFMLSMRHRLAFYRDGVFQSRLTELDMQVLSRHPGDIQLRWMILPQESRELLAELAAVVREVDGENALVDLEPIDVARGLIAIYDRLPDWTRRTTHVSANASAVRQMFKRASDPNRLIFDDIPQELSSTGNDTPRVVAGRVRDGLGELADAFPAMLLRLREGVLAALRVPNASGPMLEELRRRAVNIRGLGADHREEAFAVRLGRFNGGHEDMSGLVSLAISKPPAAWTDTDVEHAAVALAEMARRFVRREAFAHVVGRKDQRHSMAVVIGLNGRNALFQREFDVMESDQATAVALADLLESAIQADDEHDQDIVLAALAMLSARRIGAR
ncbi:MAG: ATP-binding protein [Chloroflexota bacterium]|nr:ATP-binding protein [Chloroflexota bacterium]